MSNLALKLVEGTKQDRDKYINRTEVLDKVKKISTLPDGELITTKQLAEYYDVSEDTVRVIRHRHRKEFDSDGAKTLNSREIKELKNKFCSLQNEMIKINAFLTVYTRRSALRMGMLLTDSPIAEKVRDYLLYVEEHTNKEQKQQALKFTGEWTPEMDSYILNEVSNGLDNGVGLVKAIEKIAEDLNTTRGKVQTRWYGNKNKLGLKELLTDKQKDIIKNNSNPEINKKNEQNSNVIIRTNLDSGMIIKYLNKQDEYNTLQNERLIKIEEMNEKLYKGLGSIWRQNEEFKENQDKLIEEITLVKEQIKFIAEKVDIANNEEYQTLRKRIKSLNSKLNESKLEYDELLKQIGRSTVMSGIFIDKEDVKPKSFKMDRNGNLTTM